MVLAATESSHTANRVFTISREATLNRPTVYRGIDNWDSAPIVFVMGLDMAAGKSGICDNIVFGPQPVTGVHHTKQFQQGALFTTPLFGAFLGIVDIYQG